MALVERSLHDGVMRLVLNRPERRNALSIEMYEVLTAALREASADPAVRVVTLSGAGGHFTSGNDLSDFMANPPTADGGPVFEFLSTLVVFEKPLVAGVQGAAVGIGTTLLLHCDFVYAAPTSRFRLPFVNLGLVPEAGSSLILPLLCGHVRAAELLMLGGDFDAATADRLGLLNGVVPVEGLSAAVDSVASRLCDQPLASIIATKRLMKAPQREALKAAMTAEGATFVERLSSPEAIEAFTAFFEKRKPDFRQFGG
jgi:enoyl-CoA hydratase/carnithine racemase